MLVHPLRHREAIKLTNDWIIRPERHGDGEHTSASIIAGRDPAVDFGAKLCKLTSFLLRGSFERVHTLQPAAFVEQPLGRIATEKLLGNDRLAVVGQMPSSNSISPSS